MNCIFCKIVKGEIPAEKFYESDNVIAFKDINPQAPIHFLIIPKEHIATLNDIEKNHSEVMGELFQAAKELAKRFNISETGYRCVFNCNKDAGQEVFHIHLHLLGGRKIKWPPG